MPDLVTLNGDGLPQPAPSAAAPIPGRPAPVAPCPIIVYNPVGCPGPIPPQPIVPPFHHAWIALCAPIPPIPPGPPVEPGQSVWFALALCGQGFRPFEHVTVTVVGRLGSLRFPTVASPFGTIRLGLPLTVCRVAPLYIVARGERGTVSNIIPLSPFGCLRG